MMKGFLTKNAAAKGEDKVRGGWQERYFELRDEVLYYFEIPGDEIPKGHIPLRGAKISNADSLTGKKYSIRIQQGKPIFHYLLCANQTKDILGDSVFGNSSGAEYTISVTSSTRLDLQNKDHVWYKLTLKGSGDEDRPWSVDCRFQEQQQIVTAIKEVFPISATCFPKKKGWFATASKKLGMSKLGSDANPRCKQLQIFWDSLLKEIAQYQDTDAKEVQYVYEFLGINDYERMLHIEADNNIPLYETDVTVSKDGVRLKRIIPPLTHVKDIFTAAESSVEYVRVVDPEMLRMTEIAISTRSTWFLNHFLTEVKPYTIAAAMKSVFLLRPEPIVPQKRYHQVIKDARSKKSEAGQRAYKAMLLYLDPNNYATLKRLCDMCACMAVNKDELTFLAYVFVDGVLEPEHDLERDIATEVLSSLLIHFFELRGKEEKRQEEEKKKQEVLGKEHGIARALLSKAIVERDIVMLSGAIKRAEDCSMDPMEAALLCAKKIHDDLQAYRAQLKSAVEIRDFDGVQVAMEMAQELGLAGELEALSHQFCEHLKIQEKLLISLLRAIQREDRRQLEKYLNRAEKFELKSIINPETGEFSSKLVTANTQFRHHLIVRGREVFQKLIRPKKDGNIATLEAALREKNWSLVEEVLGKGSFPSNSPVVSAAKALLREYKECKKMFRNAAFSNDPNALAEALKRAKSHGFEDALLKRRPTAPFVPYNPKAQPPTSRHNLIRTDKSSSIQPQPPPPLNDDINTSIRNHNEVRGTAPQPSVSAKKPNPYSSQPRPPPPPTDEHQPALSELKLTSMDPPPSGQPQPPPPSDDDNAEIFIPKDHQESGNVQNGKSPAVTGRNEELKGKSSSQYGGEKSELPGSDLSNTVEPDPASVTLHDGAKCSTEKGVESSEIAPKAPSDADNGLRRPDGDIPRCDSDNTDVNESNESNGYSDTKTSSSNKKNPNFNEITEGVLQEALLEEGENHQNIGLERKPKMAGDRKKQRKGEKFRPSKLAFGTIKGYRMGKDIEDDAVAALLNRQSSVPPLPPAFSREHSRSLPIRNESIAEPLKRTSMPLPPSRMSSLPPPPPSRMSTLEPEGCKSEDISDSSLPPPIVRDSSIPPPPPSTPQGDDTLGKLEPATVVEVVNNSIHRKSSSSPSLISPATASPKSNCSLKSPRADGVTNDDLKVPETTSSKEKSEAKWGQNHVLKEALSAGRWELVEEVWDKEKNKQEEQTKKRIARIWKNKEPSRNEESRRFINRKESKANEKAKEWVRKRMCLLVDVIMKHGAEAHEGHHQIKFSDLCEISQKMSDTFTGILRRAKKWKVVKYDGEGLSNHVNIMLLPRAYKEFGSKEKADEARNLEYNIHDKNY
eukprot:jgi/Bigna1/146812/aug1.121_g21520